MKEGYCIYTQQLKELGDRIMEITNTCFKMENFICKDTIRSYQNYSLGVKEYKKCIDSLAQIKFPKVVEEEHKQMINELSMFFDTTIGLLETLNKDKSECIIKSKLRLTKHITKDIIILTHRISDKLAKDI